MTMHHPAEPPIRRRAVLRGLSALPLLGVGACATVPSAALPPPPSPGSAPGAAPRAAVYTLVNRLTWGANDGEIERASHLGAEAYRHEQLAARASEALPALVQTQIDALSIQRRPLADVLADTEAQRKAADTAVGEDARKAAQDANQRELSRLAREAATRQLLRNMYSRNQLREQMSWFWFNHFNVHQYKANIRALLGDYEERALRSHALGDFRQMLGAVARHPAMLRYLDNEQNATGRVNENYARELLELHTLGVDAGYTQRDVQELARVLTGHGVNFNAGQRPSLKKEFEALYLRDGAYEFNPGRHDFGNKTVLGHTIRGRGAAELDEVLDLLVAQPATASFVCRKMAVFLLADDPPRPLVDRMAAAFGHGRIAAALDVLTSAPEFTNASGAKFKDPMHFVISAVRAAYDDRPILNTGPMQRWLNRLVQGLYNRQTPDGYPMTADAWNGSGQLAARFEVARAVGSSGAGLFKPEEGSTFREQPGFPQLARASYYGAVRPMLREDTRVALDSAASPQEWHTLLLSSPDFMSR